MLDELKSMTDINDIDLSTIETDFPLLDSGIAPAQITECEIKTEEGKKTGKPQSYLHVKYNLTAGHKTTAHEGRIVKTINPGERGSSITERIYYGVSYKKSDEGKAYGYDRIAKLREAVFGKATPGTKFAAAEMLGQNISLRLLFEPSPRNSDTGEVYGPRTSVADYIRKSR